MNPLEAFAFLDGSRAAARPNLTSAFPLTGTGSGGQVNGGLSSIPSPTMPSFGLAPASANGQSAPSAQDPASVYNGLAQAYPSREYILLCSRRADGTAHAINRRPVAWGPVSFAGK